MINEQVIRETTGFADKKAAEQRANEIELGIQAGVHGPRAKACTRRPHHEG